jgi:eukaryotic-like serine/threonine-protein kinase
MKRSLSHADADAASPAGPRLGRFMLLSLVGKSGRSMVWRALDSQSADTAHECFLVLPRNQPGDAQAAMRWEAPVRRAARLQHPQLAVPLEIGSIERWPYAMYDARGVQTLSERMAGRPMAAQDAALVLAAALGGLAFAHDGGVSHGDLQPSMLLLGEPGAVRLMGLEVGWDARQSAAAEGSGHTSIEALRLHARRDAARTDVLHMGLLLHLMLCGTPPLEQNDLGMVVARLPPLGRDIVRLPWDTPLPVPEAMRAIAHRATDRQQRQRYGSARGLARALEGWLRSEGVAGGGPLALLIDRLHSVGALPASPGSAARAARLALMDHERTNELAEVALEDLALAFELLRWVNSAQVRGAMVSGSGPVLTVRRAIAMLGMDGLRRAALGLRAWPGPLSGAAADTLQLLFEQSHRAGRVAQALRPRGYDAEAVFLITLLQNLGRLIVAYHFPDELQQIRRLMQTAPPAAPGEPEEAGMDEQAAAYAVLGADIEAIGAAVARHWGLGDAVLHMIRRLPMTATPRAIDNDDDLLRAVASCAIEAVDTLALPAERRQAALQRVAQRYARALKLKQQDLVDALAEDRAAAVGETQFG